MKGHSLNPYFSMSLNSANTPKLRTPANAVSPTPPLPPFHPFQPFSFHDSPFNSQSHALPAQAENVAAQSRRSRTPFLEEDDEIDYSPPANEDDDDYDDDEFEVPTLQAQRNGSASSGMSAGTSAHPNAAGSTTAVAQGRRKLPSIPTMKSTSKRIPVHKDPENLMIMRLRTEERYAWGVIADMMNEERAKNGGEKTWTSAAVYSRFTRNAPVIAKDKGMKFDKQDWVHIKNERKTREPKIPPMPVLNEALSMHLADAVSEVDAEFWDVVADKLYFKTGKHVSPEQCKVLMEQMRM